MQYDKIEFEVIVTPNESYEEDLKEWYREGGWDEDKPQKEFINAKIKLNGEFKGYCFSWWDVVDTKTQKDCYNNNYWYPNDGYEPVIYPSNQKKYSSFYPFTCSCGIAGCAGIWDGVHLKVRGHSVEWRVKKGMGYDFLPKRFYSFKKEEYFKAINDLEKNMKDLKV